LKKIHGIELTEDGKQCRYLFTKQDDDREYFQYGPNYARIYYVQTREKV
jgi:hypothetical protein